jgi:hypothetical protein
MPYTLNLTPYTDKFIAASCSSTVQWGDTDI